MLYTHAIFFLRTDITAIAEPNGEITLPTLSYVYVMRCEFQTVTIRTKHFIDNTLMRALTPNCLNKIKSTP